MLLTKNREIWEKGPVVVGPRNPHILKKEQKSHNFQGLSAVKFEGKMLFFRII